MLQYNKLILDSIEQEKNGANYCYSAADRKVLSELLHEINAYAGTNFNYLAELDAFNIPSTGGIVAKYITRFSSESVRGYLIPQLVADKVGECDKLILQLYLHFKSSDEYIARPGKPAPAHIYVRYDNAFKKLAPKRLAKELVALAHNPRDAFYLPFTMRMLASWRIVEMRELLILYSNDDWITAKDVGLYDNEKPYYPPLEFIKRELRFTAIDGLRHYPSDEVEDIIASLTNNADHDIRAAAKRAQRALSRKRHEI